MAAIHYQAWKQSIDAFKDCIAEEREFEFIRDSYAVLRFISRVFGHWNVGEKA